MAPNGNKFEVILFPTDFSKASDKAASYAMMMAKRNSARLVVLHVVDTSAEPVGLYVPHLSYDKLDEEMASSAEKLIERYAAKAFKGMKNVETRVATGAPYREILKAVKKEGADLVVIGTAGMGGIDRFVFGSTTERVMRKAEVPVLIIPPGA